jgi:Holliday junction DNA helicase RuvA
VWREQLTSALISLGFSAKDSDDAINVVLSDIPQEKIAQMELGELLKLALQSGKK